MARFQLAVMTQPNSINLKSTAQVSDKALKEYSSRYLQRHFLRRSCVLV